MREVRGKQNNKAERAIKPKQTPERPENTVLSGAAESDDNYLLMQTSAEYLKSTDTAKHSNIWFITGLFLNFSCDQVNLLADVCIQGHPNGAATHLYFVIDCDWSC